MRPKVKPQEVVQMKTNMTLSKDCQIHRAYDRNSVIWRFSKKDIVQLFTHQADYQTARKYWNILIQRLGKEGNQPVTDCHRLKITETKEKQRLEKKDSQSVTNCNRLKLTAIDGKKYFLLRGNKKRIKKTKGNTQ